MATKTIVITGANSGIGAELSRQYAREGAKLFLAARNEERLEAVAAECRNSGAIVETKSVDVSDAKAVEEWITSVEATTPIDIAIANAGIMETCGPDHTIESAEKSNRQIDINLGGTVNLATAVIPHMQKRKSGQLAFVASLAGIQPVADAPGYSASKAGVIAYGEALGNYVKGAGITISVICPGYITTPMVEEYDSFRPLELSAEKAAKKIRAAIRNKERFAAFPLAMFSMIKLGKLVPYSLRRHTNQPFNFTLRERKKKR